MPLLFHLSILFNRSSLSIILRSNYSSVNTALLRQKQPLALHMDDQINGANHHSQEVIPAQLYSNSGNATLPTTTHTRLDFGRCILTGKRTIFYVANPLPPITAPAIDGDSAASELPRQGSTLPTARSPIVREVIEISSLDGADSHGDGALFGRSVMGTDADRTLNGKRERQTPRATLS